MPPRTSNRRPVPLSEIAPLTQQGIEAAGSQETAEHDLAARVLYANAIGSKSDRDEVVPGSLTGLVFSSTKPPSAFPSAKIDLYLNGVKGFTWNYSGATDQLDFYAQAAASVNRYLGRSLHPWTNAFITHASITDASIDDAVSFSDAAAAPNAAGELQRNGNDLYYYDGTTAHKLNLATGYGAAGYPQDVAATEADGTAALIARSDHVHKLGILTTKGDVISYSTLPARLGVGANDTVLTAASGETTGLKWAAVNAPTLVVVTSDDTNTGQTPAASVLTFTIGASDRWAFRFTCYVDEVTDGWRSDMTVPASATGFRSSLLADPVAPVALFDADFTTDQQFATASMTTTGTMIVVEGQVAGGGTGGAVTLNFGEDGGGATGTTLKAGSYLIAHKLA